MSGESIELLLMIVMVMMVVVVTMMVMVVVAMMMVVMMLSADVLVVSGHVTLHCLSAADCRQHSGQTGHTTDQY